MKDVRLCFVALLNSVACSYNPTINLHLFGTFEVCLALGCDSPYAPRPTMNSFLAYKLTISIIPHSFLLLYSFHLVDCGDDLMRLRQLLDVEKLPQHSPVTHSMALCVRLMSGMAGICQLPGLDSDCFDVEAECK